MNHRSRLEAAYRATTYRVRAPAGAIDVRIGASAPALDALDALLEAHGADTWIIITAANPASECLPAATNAARQAALQDELLAAGYPILPSDAIADAGDWPVESGFLVIGLNAAGAEPIARRWGQLAIVIGRRAEPASLHWISIGPG